MARTILLQGGIVLIHDENDHVHAIKADVLIEGNIIAKIEADITPPSSRTRVERCVNKIICPGFISTHHHLWQTLLKGRHADELLSQYMASGNFMSSVHDPVDIFWAQIGGCMETLDEGNTTVVDHAHMNYSPDHAKAALSATMASGIRSVYCYTATPRVSMEPFAMIPELFPDWFFPTLEELADAAPFADGRVTLGFGFDGLSLPKDDVISLYSRVKALGIKTITSHYVPGVLFGTSSYPELLHSYGLLDSSILLSHATNPGPKDIELLKQTNAKVSSTPSTETQMGHGCPIAFNEDYDVTSQCSLGIDCHSNNQASIISEARLLLQTARKDYNEKFIAKGLYPKKIGRTVEEAFNLGTIQGARAIGMEDKIGSLKVGKLADIVVVDALGTRTVCAAQHDPIAAIIMHSSAVDIEMVIVDGRIRKDGSALNDVDITVGREVWSGEGRERGAYEGGLSWVVTCIELRAIREKIQKRIEKLDLDAAFKGGLKGFYTDQSKIVDKA